MAEQIIGGWYPERDLKIIAHRREGLSYGQIARIHKISRSTVAGVLYRAREAGVVVDQVSRYKLPLGGPAWSR